MKKGYVPELRFPEFQNDAGWDIATVGSKAIKVGSGITPKGGDKNYKKSGRPFIRSQNIGWGHLILDDVAFIDDDTHSTFSSTEIKANDVLLNITGASIGRSAVADSDIQGGNVNQHVCIIRTNKSELIPYFLNQYLLSSDGQKQIDSFQAGGNRQGLNFAQIRSFSFLLPSVKEQQKISDCLSSLDNVISLQTQKIDVLQQYKNGLMQKLFPAKDEIVPELRFDEFKNKPKWDTKELSQVTTLIKEKKHIDNFTINNYVSTENIKPDFLGIDIASQLPLNCRVTTFNSGDILISNIRPYLKKIWFADKSGGASNDVLVIRCKSNVSNAYLSFILKNDNFINYVMSGAKGVKMPRGDINLIKKFTVTLPSVSEQKKIANFLSSLDELIAAETQKLATLKTHKTGLMQQLFPAMDEVNA